MQKRIIITLDNDLDVQAEGFDNGLEALGLLRLAEFYLLDYVNEKTGHVEMREN